MISRIWQEQEQGRGEQEKGKGGGVSAEQGRWKSTTIYHKTILLHITCMIVFNKWEGKIPAI